MVYRLHRAHIPSAGDSGESVCRSPRHSGKTPSEGPDDAKGWSLLGKIKAALGEKDLAIEAGQRACQIWPLSTEGNWGLHALRQLTVIYAWTGEKDLAIQQLEQYAGTPQFAEYGELKLDPEWDPLRGDPRFEKIIALHEKRNP